MGSGGFRVLIMASEETLVETGRRLKIVKPKNRSSSLIEYWSPNYLGRVYRSQSRDADAESRLRPHWRKGTSITAIWPQAISAKNYLDSALPYRAIRGTKAVRLLGRLVYELIKGQASSFRSNERPSPLPLLSGPGNQALWKAWAPVDEVTVWA
jgi:hypothetical protein